MDITASTLPDLEDEDYTKFAAILKKFAEHVFTDSAKLLPVFSDLRVIEAHDAWRKDLICVKEHEPDLADGLDHFKRAGHLTFWIRRLSPVVEAHDVAGMYSDPADQVVSDAQEEMRDLLFCYANEYTAFDLGFQICKFYESELGSPRAKNLALSREYYRTVGYFLKCKTVSPHALSLIFKSLFAG